MEIAAIAGLTVAAAFLAVVLRQHKPEFALAVGLMSAQSGPGPGQPQRSSERRFPSGGIRRRFI